MKKNLLLLLFSFLFNSSYSQTYCTSNATSNADEEILGVQFGVINNTTACTNNLVGSQGTGTGTASRYSDFTSSTVPIPLLPLNTSLNFTLNAGTCGGNWNNSSRVYIDWNQDGTFSNVDEAYTVFQGINGPSTNTISVSVPSTASVGLTRLRVVLEETSSAGNVNPCGTYTWGETEDYLVFVGKKKWDYSVETMIYPDSIAFCGDEPKPVAVRIRNVENQPIEEGRVDLYIKGLNGSTTNIHEFTAFTSTIPSGAAYDVNFDDIVFPKDEILEFTFVSTHPLDSNSGNDTLRKIVQVYKNPSFELKSDTVCYGLNSSMHIEYDKTIPINVLWGNQSIKDSTQYRVAIGKKDIIHGDTIFGVNLEVSVNRGWKCFHDTFIRVMVNPVPNFSVSNDTVLCVGQSDILEAIINEGQTIKFYWDGDSVDSPTLSVGSVAKTYYVEGVNSFNCRLEDSVKVGVSAPPTPAVKNDEVCIGETAQIGIIATDPYFLYEWKTLNGETTPLVYLTPPGSNSYFVHYYYKGCHDSVLATVVVNPLPTVTTSVTTPSICHGFSSTISASGAVSYKWNDGSTSASRVVSPPTSKVYKVVGIDAKGCTNESNVTVNVYPKTEVTVYSNKYLNNVCLGDSATIYANGAATYKWSTGDTDSVLYFTPTQSTEYTVTATDAYNCKDTITYRLNVKPKLDVTVYPEVGCEGDVVNLKVSGGPDADSYNWGIYGDDSVSSDIILAKTTSYVAYVTSKEGCRKTVYVPVTVWEKPVAQASDANICKGGTATIEASGGSSYRWSSGGNSSIETVSPQASTEYTVTVTNDAGCSSEAIANVNIVSSPEIVFKSPIDSYDCPNKPVTMVATPYGGVWTGVQVEKNLLHAESLPDGIYSIIYTVLDPINSCISSDTVQVKISRACSYNSSISVTGILDEGQWIAYPNPFDNRITVKINHNIIEEASIKLYDMSGRALVEKQVRLNSGTNVFEFDGLSLAKGSYILELETSHVNKQMKLIKE